MTRQGAWVSYARCDSELIAMMTHDLWERDQARAIEATKILGKGGPLPASECPDRLWTEPDCERIDPLPDLFVVQDHYVVSARAADIMKDFNLGDGALYPVAEGAYEEGNVDRIPGDFFCWVIGNVKQAFLPETSRKLPFGVAGERWCLPVLPQDGDIAVSSAALDGPDIWLDPKLFKSIFVSGPLGCALADAGLAHAFRLKRCRVL